MTSLAPTTHQRLQAMINFELVAVITRPHEGADLHALLNAHLDFMVELEQRGHLLLSGPLSGPHTLQGEGLSILNTHDIEEARAIWHNEPFHQAGLRSASFHVWTLMEGRLGLTLDLSVRQATLARPAARN